MSDNCLNCKYEPDWSEFSSREYSTCSGECKWNEPLQILPAVYKGRKKYYVSRYADDSGIHSSDCCKTWASKGEIA